MCRDLSLKNLFTSKGTILHLQLYIIDDLDIFGLLTQYLCSFEHRHKGRDSKRNLR